MTSVDVVLTLVKIAIIIGFLLNVAAIATWADRRQSAMVQDRVGPNRAVVSLPSTVVRIVLLLPPTLFGLFAVFGIALPPLRGAIAFDRMVAAVQLAVLVGWLGLVVLAGYLRRREPLNALEAWLARANVRSIVFAGLVVHVVALAATQLVPPSAVALGAKVAGWVLALVLFASGVYAASRVPDGPVPIRLAGMLHAAADAIKLIWKEDFVPKNADRLLHSLAPILAMFPALVTFAVIPFGDGVCFVDNGNKVFDFGDLARMAPTSGRPLTCPNGHLVKLQIADLNVGILYLFAMAGTGVIGAALAGWASDNKFSLLGGLRAASQMVSYEVSMGISLIGLFILYSTVRLGPMVEWQRDNAWGVFVQPFAFFLFLAALTAETKRVPFDQPEGESEIVAGYFVEYSGMKFGMFYTGEYIELITSSAILVTLFFGGWALPFLYRDGIVVSFGDTTLFTYKMTHLAVTLVQIFAFFAKVLFVTWVQIFFRWTLPRFRYDQVMKLGWTVLLPLAIVNLLVTGVVVLAVDAAGPVVTRVLAVVGDVTKAIVALGMLAGVVALVAGLLEPARHRRFLRSTAARFAAARGGTRPEPQQA